MNPAQPRRRYKNPPLAEAVLEFQFGPAGSPWDSIFFGEIRARLKEEFPAYETLQRADIELSDSGAALRSAPEFKRFRSEDGGLVLTVGPGIMGLSLIPPKREAGHLGWEAFRDTALRILGVYNDVAKPDGITQVGVRYINALSVSSGAMPLSSVFSEASGLVPRRLLKESDGFSYRYERVASPYCGGVHRECLQLAGIPNAETLNLVADFDEVWNRADEAEVDLGTVCNMLHDAGYKLFQTVFSSRMRELFKPEPKTRGGS